MVNNELEMSHQKLGGKVVLVTGASSGIGKAIAIEMGKQGASVIINYYSDEEGAEDTLKQIVAAGSKGVIAQADVSNEQDVINLFGQVKKQFAKLDILVNNAGVQVDRYLVDMKLEDWKKVMDTNLTGQFICSREAAKMMLKNRKTKKQKECIGNIIFISSVHDVIPWAGHVNYAASKGGVLMLMKSIAQELAPSGIRVNSIAPGAIKTAINKEEWENDKEREKLLRLIPYGRIGEPEDVAKTAVWLASDDADYIVGATIYIDGGMTLYPGSADE